MVAFDVVNNPDDFDVVQGRLFRVDRFVLHPGQWKAFTRAAAPRVKWRKIKFTKGGAAKVPNNAHGVYTFVAKPEIASHPACAYLLYVGKADDTDFRTRYRSYLAEPTKKKPRPHIAQMVKKWDEHLWFYYAPVANKALIASFEEALIGALIPPFNREFPATIKRWVAAVFA